MSAPTRDLRRAKAEWTEAPADGADEETLALIESEVMAAEEACGIEVGGPESIVTLTTPAPPTDLVELIRLAATDARKLDRDSYLPNSGMWHEPGARCRVCFAGSIVANTLRAPLDKSMAPADFPTSWSDALWALENVRCAMWSSLIKNNWLAEDEAAALDSAFPPVPEHEEFGSWRVFSLFLEWADSVADKLEELRTGAAPSPCA